MTIINGSMTLDEVEEALIKRFVGDLDVSLSQLGHTSAHATLDALSGPGGRAYVPRQDGLSLADALNRLCECADALAEAEVRVLDNTGRLRGRYKATPEGYSLAEKHMRSLGRGASVVSPGK